MKHTSKKLFSTRRDLFAAIRGIREITMALCDALEAANACDREPGDRSDYQKGTMGHWAGGSVYGRIAAALDQVLRDTFGVTLGDLDVDWGAHGDGTWWHDLREALAKALIPESDMVEVLKAKAAESAGQCIVTRVTLHEPVRHITAFGAEDGYRVNWSCDNSSNDYAVIGCLPDGRAFCILVEEDA